MTMASQYNTPQASASRKSGAPLAPVRDFGRVNGAAGIAVDRNALHGHALSVIKRLQTCLDEETAVLARSQPADLEIFNHRKGQGLMELNRALGAVGKLSANSDVAIELSQLRLKIDENMRVLRLHISAVNEITGLLTDAIQREESDGTYSPSTRSQWR